MFWFTVYRTAVIQFERSYVDLVLTYLGNKVALANQRSRQQNTPTRLFHTPALMRYFQSMNKVGVAGPRIQLGVPDA